MALIETEAFVLNTYGLSEADKIVVLFTRQQGMIRAVAKGARRLNSKFGSSFEIFSEIKVSYVQKEDRELVAIQETELLSSRFSLIGDSIIYSTLSYFSELISSFMPLNDANEVLYRLIDSSIKAIESSNKISRLRLYFEVWLLRLNGYLPEWRNCGICKKTFAEDEAAGLAADLDLICRECDKFRSIKNISPDERRLMKKALRMPPYEFASADSKERDGVQNLLYVTGHLIKRALNKQVTSPQIADRAN